MIPGHEFYEMQSALAATGQLSDTELTELEQHAAECASCRECIAEMAEMSRELFLLQAQRVHAKGTPARMQERFLEKAASAGIPVSRSSSAVLDPRLAGVIAIAALLAIAVSLGWSRSSVPPRERAASSIPSTPGTQATSLAEASPAAGGSMSKAGLRKRSTLQRRAVMNSSAAGSKRQFYLEQDRSIVANRASTTSFAQEGSFWSGGLSGSHVVAEMHTPTISFFNDASVAGFFGRKETDKPDQRAFHLDRKLASLSFLDFPQKDGPTYEINNLKFSTPVFHLSPNTVW